VRGTRCLFKRPRANALVGGVRYDIARLGMGSFWYVVTILVPILWIAHVLAFLLLVRRRA
jgi:hypothetical protein